MFAYTSRHEKTNVPSLDTTKMSLIVSVSSDFLFSMIFTCSPPSAFATDRVGGLHDKLVFMQGRLPKIRGKKTNTWARFFCLFSGREHAWGELRSAELSTSLQISVFLFLCELSSPWASSQNDRWSWANWEGVSCTLSNAELCNNGPYLDARTDRISPHTSLLPSHTLPHPQKDPLSRISTSKSSQSLDQSSMICRPVVESNYCLLCDVIYPTSLAQASFKKIM